MGDNQAASFIWQIIHENPSRSTVLSHGSKVRLRHALSGLYLCMYQQELQKGGSAVDGVTLVRPPSLAELLDVHNNHLTDPFLVRNEYLPAQLLEQEKLEQSSGAVTSGWEIGVSPTVNDDCLFEIRSLNAHHQDLSVSTSENASSSTPSSWEASNELTYDTHVRYIHCTSGLTFELNVSGVCQ